MTTLLLCPRCGAFHNGDGKECVLCYRPAAVQNPSIATVGDRIVKLIERMQKVDDGYVDRLVVAGQTFERNHARLFSLWTTRGHGRHEHLEGMGTDLREANINLLRKICAFEMRELLGCHEGPKSRTDWNLRHGKARGVNLEDWIDGEIEKEDR